MNSAEEEEEDAQAYLYAKELINDGDDDDDEEDENDNDNDNDGDDPNEEEERQELDRIRTVVKAEMKVKTNIDCSENIAMNQDSGNDKRFAISSLQASTTKKTSKQPGVKGYCKIKSSGNYKVQVQYLGKQLYFGIYQSEREAAIAYTIAKDEMSQSPVLIPLKTKTTAKDKDWELIRTEIQNIIKTATPNEIKEMLAVLPKLKKNGYSKTYGKLTVRINFGGKRRHIGTFEEESKAELAYSLAYHKKINYIPSSYSTTTTTAAASTSTSTQISSSTEEVSPQSTSSPPPLVSIGAAAAAAAKRDIGAVVSSSIATTSNKRQKLNTINDDNNHHDDISPYDDEDAGDGNTVPSAEPKKGPPTKLKAFSVSAGIGKIAAASSSSSGTMSSTRNVLAAATAVLVANQESELIAKAVTREGDEEEKKDDDDEKEGALPSSSTNDWVDGKGWIREPDDDNVVYI